MADPYEGYDRAELSRLQSIFGSTGGEDFAAQIGIQNVAGYDPYSSDDYKQDNSGDVNDQKPARLSDIPTSSTNVNRPRTVAAGYNPHQSGGTLTVMFRDGTLYNYYGVSPDEWIKFHESISKGKPWLNSTFLAKNRGPADLAGVDDATLAEIYRVARISQFRYQSRRPSVRGTNQYGVPKAAQTKSQLSPRSATSRNMQAATAPSSKGGTNPHKHAGKNKRK